MQNLHIPNEVVQLASAGIVNPPTVRRKKKTFRMRSFLILSVSSYHKQSDDHFNKKTNKQLITLKRCKLTRREYVDRIMFAVHRHRTASVHWNTKKNQLNLTAIFQYCIEYKRMFRDRILNQTLETLMDRAEWITSSKLKRAKNRKALMMISMKVVEESWAMLGRSIFKCK